MTSVADPEPQPPTPVPPSVPRLPYRARSTGLAATRTMADQVYLWLRERIIHLDVAPGERLSEARLAQELGVSRSPVKDALRRLAEEGLVEIRPQYGSFVAGISREAALQILEVRMLLEPFAAYRAAPNLSSEELETLQRLFDQAEALPAGSPEKATAVWRADDQLHLIIARASGNQEIVRIVSSYHDRINRVRRATARYTDRLSDSFSEMKGIFAALKRRDPGGASEAMRLHLANIDTAVRQLPTQP